MAPEYGSRIHVGRRYWTTAISRCSDRQSTAPSSGAGFRLSRTLPAVQHRVRLSSRVGHTRTDYFLQADLICYLELREAAAWRGIPRRTHLQSLLANCEADRPAGSCARLITLFQLIRPSSSARTDGDERPLVVISAKDKHITEHLRGRRDPKRAHFRHYRAVRGKAGRP